MTREYPLTGPRSVIGPARTLCITECLATGRVHAYARDSAHDQCTESQTYADRAALDEALRLAGVALGPELVLRATGCVGRFCRHRRDLGGLCLECIQANADQLAWDAMAARVSDRAAWEDK